MASHREHLCEEADMQDLQSSGCQATHLYHQQMLEWIPWQFNIWRSWLLLLAGDERTLTGCIVYCAHLISSNDAVIWKSRKLRCHIITDWQTDFIYFELSIVRNAATIYTKVHKGTKALNATSHFNDWQDAIK